MKKLEQNKNKGIIKPLSLSPLEGKKTLQLVFLNKFVGTEMALIPYLGVNNFVLLIVSEFNSFHDN